MSQDFKKIKRLLVANRSEIAIRVMRAANELGIATIGIYSDEDRFALHRFKADESYPVGHGMGPIEAYLSIEEVLRVAREHKADAIHPGYGFLSESPEFAEACAEAGIVFIGPAPEVMRSLGNKVSARNLAVEAGVPVMPASEPLPEDLGECARIAEEIGYPLMLKASWGGGGRGMRVIQEPKQLEHEVTAGRREAKAAFGKDEVYLEKLVERARHVEVQILGDLHGNLVHLFERDCTVQRRHQKVIERAPAPYVNDALREKICGAALRLGEAVGYSCAGTVEFLMDADSEDFYFIEVNPRIQVEHTVTEQVTGVDIVKAQIRVSEGEAIGAPDSPVPAQDKLFLYGHALQCRVTTENPEQNFIPDYGRIQIYRGANGFGIRLDGGTAYSGALITRYYDSLLEKVTAWGPTPGEAIARMRRALGEFRIRGVATNLLFLENLVDHPKFRNAEYTTRFIDETPELLEIPERKDRATRLLNFIADVTVNGNKEVAGRDPALFRAAPPMPQRLPKEPAPGTKQKLDELGPERFAQWMRDETRLLVTDTTMRDAHQSLLATRMRSRDIVEIAPAYARSLPELFSLECWGGATFDVALRFLKEDPWERLAELRERVPNVLLQMLFRSANGVGYKNYPDNVVRYFVQQAADAGMDVFRLFDALNLTENMRVAIDAVLETDKLCEAAICYSGDLTDPNEDKFTLKYYVDLAKEFEKAGAHILGIKDMAGLCKPEAARRLVTTLKDETGLPIHFHTHDTSGISAASVFAASEAGVDAVDAAIDAMSGVTSQPILGSIVHALRHGERDTGLDQEAIRQISTYWEWVRHYYRPFEADIPAGTAEVYLHEIPGGQYTNLRAQARSMGLEDKWPQIADTYAEVNEMFGNIVKVTPTSKVVGDLALYMVASGLSAEDVVNPEKDVAFPESVISLFKGELGMPPEGFPEALSKKILKGEKPLEGRAGALLPPADLDGEREKAEEAAGREVSDRDLASYLMYPQVFAEYAHHQRDYGNVSRLTTPVFYYGMDVGEEISVDIDQGKTLIIRSLGMSEVDEDGHQRVFFELNGQPRQVKLANRKYAEPERENEKADDKNPDHVAAPMPGLVANISVAEGQTVEAGDVLLTIEAMKMMTAIHAERAGRIARVPVKAGSQIDAHDLLVVYGEEDGDDAGEESQAAK